VSKEDKFVTGFGVKKKGRQNERKSVRHVEIKQRVVKVAILAPEMNEGSRGT
jgi:hypothetical protein